MKNLNTLAQSQKAASNPFGTGRLLVRPNPNFSRTMTHPYLRTLYNRANWLTVLRSARVAGLNA